MSRNKQADESEVKEPVNEGPEPKEDYAVTIKRNNYSISYYPNRIVLKGANEAIHNEANRIMNQFSFSAQPYCMESETTDLIVIVPSATSAVL